MQFLDIIGLKRLKTWISSKFYTKAEVDSKIPSLENYATKNDVSNAIDDLIGTAPTALDTLGEIAEALSNGEAVESALTNQIAAKYTKPSTGIPATDLSSDVQSALNNANSAIKTETDPIFSASAASTIQSTDIENWNSKTSNTGTITGITMNGTNKGTSGVVDLGTVLTEHQDISGKANTSDIKDASLTLRANNTDYTTKFSANAATDTTIDLGYMVHTIGTGSDIQSGNITLKTVNNTSLLGNGDIPTEFTTNKVNVISDASTNVQYPSAKLLYDELYGDNETCGEPVILRDATTAEKDKHFAAAYDTYDSIIADADRYDYGFWAVYSNTTSEIKRIKLRCTWNPYSDSVNGNVTFWNGDRFESVIRTGDESWVYHNNNLWPTGGESDGITFYSENAVIPTGCAEYAELEVPAHWDMIIHIWNLNEKLLSGTITSEECIVNKVARSSDLPTPSFTLPLMDYSYAHYGLLKTYARADHRHPRDTSKEDISNKVTSLSSSSTDTQYPSAKCVYDIIGDIESVLDQIIQPTNS